MDKDQSLDALLRQTMPAGETPAVASPCLDAETLAAWMADSLSQAERASAEVHLAGCDRCLAVVAAIAKTEPPPSLAPRSRWFSVRWLVPAATAAVGGIDPEEGQRLARGRRAPRAKARGLRPHGSAGPHGAAGLYSPAVTRIDLNPKV